MISTTSKITAAASRNRELLDILSATDHAHTELEQQDRYLADLHGSIQQAVAQVADLDAKRLQELKEHTKLRDSIVKRFAYKVAGKKETFEAKAGKEEREYFDALQDEHKAKQMLQSLEDAVVTAKQTRENIVHQVHAHDAAQKDLDALYEAVFQGPSPGFPTEDRAEAERQGALANFRNVRSGADAEAQAIKILEQATVKMATALSYMDDAMRHSRMDMWGGGSFVDMMERNALSKAGVLATEARVAMAQAQKFDGQVRMPPAIRVPQGDILTDVFFDNVYTDMMFHQKIKQGVAEMQHSRNFIEGQLGEARNRAGWLAGEVAKAQSVLERARVELERVRVCEFEKVVKGMK